MIVRNPAWQSLSPALPQFEAADSKTQSYFENQLNMQGQLFKARFDQDCSKAYLFKSSENKEQYFIKKVSHEEVENHQKCDDLTQWVSTSDYRVNASMSHFFNKEEHTFYYVYSYISGSRILASEEYMIHLGTALAKLHQKLKGYPHVSQITTQTAHRKKKLNELRAELSNNQHQTIPHASFVKNLAQDYDFECINEDNVQIIHGDLNAGNLLFSDNLICFFDFEDALHSFSSVIFDLLFVIERVIFTQISCDYERVRLSKKLLETYKNMGGTYSYQKNDEFCLTLMSLRAFCLLTNKLAYGYEVLDSEWNKFLELSKNGINQHQIIKKILQG